MTFPGAAEPQGSSQGQPNLQGPDQGQRLSPRTLPRVAEDPGPPIGATKPPGTIRGAVVPPGALPVAAAPQGTLPGAEEYPGTLPEAVPHPGTLPWVPRAL
ncbi:basic proline-rich protein-like [Homarus americanus]|uniref:basic proline-rich protein-like n=1 Tax=Homarus americanus TaxID=6706 RepID=UPI001C44AC22|nr:basic proline-rich protein-like [Homarus americanus]